MQVCLRCELADFLAVMFDDIEGNSFFNAVVPHRVLYATWKLAKHLASYEQHDAHEYLLCLLGSLLACEETTIPDLFRGSLRSDVVCVGCGAKSSCIESFLDLSLSIGTYSRLEDCIAHFTSPETLGDVHICDYCGVGVQRLKQLTINSLPNVLVVHLKRFDAFSSQKLTDVVLFPADCPLDLGPHLTRWRTVDSAAKPPLSNHLYDLRAVINHHGSLSHGHYTSFVKADRSWFYCDDHMVSRVDLDSIKQSEAYILFYTRTVPPADRH